MAVKVRRIYLETADSDTFTVTKVTNTTLPFVGMPMSKQEVDDLCASPQYEVTITAAKPEK